MDAIRTKQRTTRGLSTAPFLLSLLACAPPVQIGAPPDPSAFDTVIGLSVRAQLQSATAAVASRPDDDQAWRSLGYVYENASLPAPALEAYRNAARLDPERAQTHYRAAVVAGQVEELELALELVDQALEHAPEYGPAHLRRGEWLLELGQLEAARVAIDEAARLLPEAPDGDLARARLALLEDDVTGALTFVEKARRLAPQDPFLRQILGTALRRAGRLEEALPHLRAGQGSRLRRSDPWSQQVHAQGENKAQEQEAQQLEAAGRWEAALALYQELLRQRPGDIRLTIRSGLCLSRLLRHAESLALHEKALGEAPGQYDLAVAYADALRIAGDGEKAMKTIERAIEDWPDRPTAYLAHGNILSSAGDPLGALESFAQAVRCDPADLRARYFQGRLFSQLGSWSDAAETLTAGLAGEEQPGMTYFQALVQAQRKAGVPDDELQRTLQAAQRLHGSAASVLAQ